MREWLAQWPSVCLAILLATGCSDPSTPGTSSGDVSDALPEIDAEDPDTAETECTQDADCDAGDPCVLQSLCIESVCVQAIADEGEVCEDGCLIGVCDGQGQCTNLTLRTCEETDGNLCTLPSCDSKTGECTEEILADGEEPYASTDCFVGAACLNGESDTSAAEPSELALQCDALSAGLDPLGCIDQFVCVGGDIGCQAIPRPEGSACWIDAEEPSGDTCQGHACFEGECAIDNALSVVCGEENLPAECDASCAECTELTCKWIPDPISPDLPTRIAHCSPQATPEEACLGDPCSLEQTCAVGAPTTGPTGKETLGFCTGGVDKTKEQCAEELSLPPIDCILAGITCDGELGCHFQKNVADQWCLASASQCVNTADTYCSHLDAGELWDPATGCHVATLEINCDDANDCTLDTCTNGAVGPECLHQAIEGAACDDEDPCTFPGICAGKTCTNIAPKCVNTNDNPCDDVQCAPITGQCVPAPVVGTSCEDAEICTTATTCLESGLCGGGSPLDCGDGNDCTDDPCAPGIGCDHVLGAGPCSDENACTLDDVCVGFECEGQYSCNDDNLCTADACDPAQGCSNTPVPDEAQLTCVAGNTQWKCVGGECECSPKCALLSCGSDGCGGTCTCIKDTLCENEVCVPTETGGTSGDWLVSANPSQQTLAGLLPVTFVSTLYTLDIVGSALTGSTSAQGITVNYTGTVNGNDFTMNGSYSNSSLGLTETHVENWSCTFTSATEFTGTMTDTITLLGSPFGNLTWNVTGILQ